MPYDPQIIYTPAYDIHFYGIEKMHPFDTRKYSRAYALMRAACGESLLRRTRRPLAPANRADLLTVHSADYLRSLRSSRQIARIVEMPILARLPQPLLYLRVLRPMLWGVAGTMLATDLAFQAGIAVDLSGGYHHCHRDNGEGFTIFSDIGIAIHHARHSGLLPPEKKVLIIDLDAHQGNGHERIFANNPSIYIFDMYNMDIYPRDSSARARIDWDIPLLSGCEGRDYLRTLKAALPKAIAAAGDVGLALYIAGTDVYERDLLGRMRLDDDEVVARDQYVFQTLRAANIPCVMTLGGGYSRESYQLIARSVMTLL